MVSMETMALNLAGVQGHCSVLKILVVLTLPFSDKQRIFSNMKFCNIWGFMFNIMAASSIVLVAVLSITRTVFLMNPYRKINR